MRCITAWPSGAKRPAFHREDLFVVVFEPPLENWSTGDGVSSADRKPGFKLDV